MALFLWHCSGLGLLAGTLSPCINPSCLSSASFLLWWKILSSPCKHLDYAAPCILSCCSFNLEFTSLADSSVTKEFGYTSLLYKLLKTDLFTAAPLSRILNGALHKNF